MTTEGKGSVTTSAKPYKGMPSVGANCGRQGCRHLELSESLSKKIVEAKSRGPISISLESLDVDLQHNREFRHGVGFDRLHFESRRTELLTALRVTPA